MPSFKYAVMEPTGKEKKGTIEAANEQAATEELRAKGWILLSLSEPSLFSKDLNISFGKAVKSRDLSVFCRQFSSVLSAGVTVLEALRMLSEQTENKEFSKTIREVSQSVERGETLGGAMGAAPKIFPSILVHMVEAGEASGSLEISFERMAIHFEKDSHLKGMIMKAMIYPIILILVVIGVVIVMMVAIIPQFTATFAESGTALPGITLAVMAISDFIVTKWYLLAAGVAAAVAAFRAISKTKTGALFFGRVALKLPLVGNLSIKSASARLTRTLSTLLGAGISLMDAVDISAKIMGNRAIKESMIVVREEVERGVPLSQPLEATGVFPALVYHMVKIGEETGNIEDMLDKVADYYDEEVEMATQSLTAALEPLIIVVMAAVVVPIILAIMMPMMNIYSAVEGG